MLSLVKQAIEEGKLPSNRQLQQVDEVLQGVQHFIEDMRTSENPDDQQGLTLILRLMVYSRVLRSDLSTIRLAEHVRNLPMVYQLGLDYSHIVSNFLQVIKDSDLLDETGRLRTELTNLKKWSDDENATIRESVMKHAAMNSLNAVQRLDLLAALRWLNRLISHTQRLSNVLFEDAKQR